MAEIAEQPDAKRLLAAAARAGAARAARTAGRGAPGDARRLLPRPRRRAAGAEVAVLHFDRLAELREDVTPARALGAEAAAELVREAWMTFEESNVAPALALEALFVQLRRALT